MNYAQIRESVLRGVSGGAEAIVGRSMMVQCIATAKIIVGA
jgi:hypothetical protein